MPCTTVQKITGAIIILINATNPSPRGFMAVPASGNHHPVQAPIPMAKSTWIQRLRYQGTGRMRALRLVSIIGSGLRGGEWELLICEDEETEERRGGKEWDRTCR